MRKHLQDVMRLATTDEERQTAEEVAQSLLNYEFDETTLGAPLNHAGTWASAVRMINARDGTTLCNYELPEGEAAFRFAIAKRPLAHSKSHFPSYF